MESWSKSRDPRRTYSVSRLLKRCMRRERTSGSDVLAAYSSLRAMPADAQGYALNGGFTLAAGICPNIRSTKALVKTGTLAFHRRSRTQQWTNKGPKAARSP